jgi:predicted transposase/invertase (TIGR01784 family)
VLFYWAHLHIGQLLQGDYYETLMPSFSLCFLQGNFFPDDSFHHSFSLLDPTTGQSLTTDLEIHTFELSKFNLPVEQVQTGLHRWCYFLKHGASLDLERLPVQLDVPPIRQALEVLMKFSQDEIERIRILDRQKAIADATTLRIEAETALQRGLERGLEQGLERGLARGLESGEWIGRIHFAQEMLGQPATPRSQLEQLSLGQLEEMAAELRRQVVARRNGNQTETP